MTPQSEEQKKKVLLVITLFSIGGATETVVNLAAGLLAKRYAVKIVTGPPLKNEGDLFAQAKAAGIEVEVMDDLVRDINPWRDAVCLFKLTALMRREQYDIVHTHSSKAGFLGRIAGWLAGVPRVLHTIHGLPYHDYQHPFWKWTYIALEKAAAYFCDTIICVSDAIIENCVRTSIAPRNKFVQIRSGFETKHFIEELSHREEIRNRYGFAPDDVIAGTISRIAPLKGHDHIIALAQRTKGTMPALKFFFVGDGESKQEMERTVQTLGLEKVVIFSGLVQPDRIPEMISAMDFIVHLSLREGLARVLPQSIVMGRKVVTYGIEGVNEVIFSEDGGAIVAPGDMEELMTAVQRLVGSAQQRRIPEEYRQRVTAEFDSSTMIDRHILVYQRGRAL